MTRNFLYLQCLLLLILFTSCEKINTILPFDFDVKSVRVDGTATNEFLLKDTVRFTFTGNPDVITFYSGKVGQRYDFRNREEAIGKPVVTFLSAMSAAGQTNTLSLLVSPDFKGVIDSVKWEIVKRDTINTSKRITEATWTDITSQAKWSDGTSNTAVNSGEVDLSDIASKYKQVYLAFRYTALPDKVQPKWTITGLQVNNILDDGTKYTIANFNGPAVSFLNYQQPSFSPGWVTAFDPQVNSNNNVAWLYNAVTNGSNVQRLEITGANALNARKAEVWAIMGPINLRKVTPDRGVAIKNIINRLNSYSISRTDAYTAAGTYKVVFAVKSQSPRRLQEQVKEVTLVIKPN